MKCDELKRKYSDITGPYYGCNEVDEAIDELKKKLMPCLNGDCILTCEVVEKYGKENAELKAEIESLKASHYAEMVDRTDDLYYLKSEADKVIEELKADYREACGRLQTANLIKDEQLAATRHSKLKRCLNKAEWCEERSARYDLLQERTGFDWSREIGFYFKWQQRWLALAEEPTWAKFLQLIHKEADK